MIMNLPAIGTQLQAQLPLVKYKTMCQAIAQCFRFDECKDLIDKSVALAAYYAQIKDTKTELMFNRIRVRAWRRISELLSSVDLSACETQTAKVKKIRTAFPDDGTIADMPDSRIIELIKLIDMPASDFEFAVNQEISGSLPDLLRRTPAYVAMVEENRRARDKADREYAEKREQREHEEREQDNIQTKHINELWGAANQAMKEVGITLKRKDRANIKQVVFLIKDDVHAVMRQAAFDKHITMQEVLRRGLKLWLEANGYDWPSDNTHDG
jgi:hypothetical protein